MRALLLASIILVGATLTACGSLSYVPSRELDRSLAPRTAAVVLEEAFEAGYVHESIESIRWSDGRKRLLIAHATAARRTAVEAVPGETVWFPRELDGAIVIVFDGYEYDAGGDRGMVRVETDFGVFGFPFESEDRALRTMDALVSLGFRQKS